MLNLAPLGLTKSGLHSELVLLPVHIYVPNCLGQESQ